MDGKFVLCLDLFSMKKIRIFENKNKAFEQIEDKKARRVVIGDYKICLARDGNNLFAVNDSCPHSAASLSKGIVNFRGEIVCPLHSYCYDLKTGREFQQKTADVRTWQLIEEETGIYIILA